MACRLHAGAVDGVWVGYDKDRNISAVESHLAAPIFAEFTERTLESVPPKLFPIPEGVVNVYIDPATGKLANESCPDSRMEAFVQARSQRNTARSSRPGMTETEFRTGEKKTKRHVVGRPEALVEQLAPGAEWEASGLRTPAASTT